MYSVWVWSVLFLLSLWLGVLTILVWQKRKFLTELFPQSEERDIRKKFRELLESINENNKNLDLMADRVAAAEADSEGSIRNIRLLRYNPFGDTGGDQSFSIAFLNKKGSGVVITSLHARNGTRVFAKQIEDGQAEKYQLSKEEEIVVQKALKDR